MYIIAIKPSMHIIPFSLDRLVAGDLRIWFGSSYFTLDDITMVTFSGVYIVPSISRVICHKIKIILRIVLCD